MADNSNGGDEDQGPPPDAPAAGEPDNVVQGPWWPEGECPSALLFAEYLDERLPEAQRQRVYDHLCECSRCRHDRTLIIALLLEIASLDDPGALERAKGVARTSLRLLVGPWADLARANDDERDRREADSSTPGANQVMAAPAVARNRIRYTAAIALTAACVAALVSIGSGFLPRLRSAFRSEQLDSFTTVPRERPFAARFTGKFPWAPTTALTGDSRAEYDRYVPREAVTYLMAAERRGRPPEAPNATILGMVGASQVLTGRVEPGVETLRRASAAQPRSAELLSDLGAALLARAESGRPSVEGDGESAAGNRDADYADGLENIDRALEISPHLEEALFNRALALERLYLLRSARQSWQAYIDIDPRSEWAREARRRMSAISIPARVDPGQVRNALAAAAAAGKRDRVSELVLSHRQLARRSVQEELLPKWGEAWLSRDFDQADRQLETARVIAEEWEVQTGDRSLRGAVDDIARSADARRETIAAGYRSLGLAYRAFGAFDIPEAQAAADSSLRALPTSTPGHTWARLVALVCTLYRNGELESEASSINSAAPDELATVGRVNWLLGLWHAKRGNPATGLVYLRKSLEAYDEIGEVESIAWLHYLIGEAYGYLGAGDTGWSERRLALQHAHSFAGAQGELATLVGSAMLALFEGRPRAAADFLQEGLIEPSVDEADQQGPEIAQAYVWRSRVMHELGRDAEARRDLQHAASWLGRVTPTARRYLAGEMSLAAGLLDTDAKRAIERLSRALAQFRDVGPTWRLPGVFLARARANLRAGDLETADADLRQGVLLLQQQQQASPARSDVVLARRLDGPQELSDERVKLALRRGDTEAAFAIAEASRSEGALAPRVPKPLQAWEVAQRLEAGTTLLFYSWLPDRIVSWRLSRDAVSFEQLEIQPSEAMQLVSAFDADLKVGAWTAATQVTAQRLYDALLGPVRVSSGRLVIVPDGALHELPFAATINPRSGHFLIEESEVTVAPSAAAFLHGRERWQDQSHPADDALVIGDPRVDPTLFPDIRPLAGARSEARAVAALYPNRELLLGGAATREAFLMAVGHRPVIHFAGHAMTNRVDPAQTSLPLASDANGSQGLLVAANIARLDLTDTSTVVLSGCETGIGEAGDGEGPLSLARAFLVAGTPTVVASLWPIADAPSAPLMTAFHRRLREGERPASALRGAQLELLRSRDPILRSPGVWAAFAAIGG